MGFNPFRPSRTSRLDVVLVLAAILLTTAVVVWAMKG
jgi:hypothetical protein